MTKALVRNDDLAQVLTDGGVIQELARAIHKLRYKAKGHIKLKSALEVLLALGKKSQSDRVTGCSWV